MTLRIHKKTTTHNSTYPKVAVQWLNQALCFYQSFCLVDSEVLLNRHLRVAAKRWATYKKAHRTNRHTCPSGRRVWFCRHGKPMLKNQKSLFFASARTE